MTKVTTSVAANRPASLHLIGPSNLAFAEAVVHIRSGYCFHPDRPVEILGQGNVSFYLVLGNVDQMVIDMAKDSTELAIQQQAAEFDAAVRHAAGIMVERQAREALEKQVAEAVAASEKAIAQMKKQAEAELAKLTK